MAATFFHVLDPTERLKESNKNQKYLIMVIKPNGVVTKVIIT